MKRRDVLKTALSVPLLALGLWPRPVAVRRSKPYMHDCGPGMPSEKDLDAQIAAFPRKITMVGLDELEVTRTDGRVFRYRPADFAGSD